MATDPQTLLTAASCAACYKEPQIQLMQLSTLAQWAGNKGMRTDPAYLLSQSNCFACYMTDKSSVQLMRLSLLAQIAAMAAPPAPPALDPVVSAWKARAIANGGTPGVQSVNAVNTLWLNIKAAGIDSKIIHLNPIAPDDLPTAKTPLVLGPGGLAMWQTQGTIDSVNGGSLLNGLIGNNSGYYVTGVVPAGTPMAAHNSGITIYASQADPNAANQHTYAGCDNYPSPGNSQFKLIYNVEFIAFNNSSTDGYVVATAPTAFTGYLSANVTSVSWAVYSGSSGGFQTLTNTGGGTLGGGSGPVTTPSAVAFFDVNGQFHEPTAARLSFAAFHLGLLQSEAQALFNAVQLYRQTLGGGYV